jgi:SAM-dependent methyltransferase
MISSPRSTSVRRIIRDMPIVGLIARKLYRLVVPSQNQVRLESSAQYWEDRYGRGGNSGSGSYGRLALFKAEIINKFISDNDIHTVVEFGCGDGAQLKHADYQHYTGVDVSWRAVELCRANFSHDPSKEFFHISEPEANTTRAELALSLDVIYHLVEDDVYHAYMWRLVRAASRFVCIYSSNFESEGPEPHIRHRCFLDWMASNAPSWHLILRVPNLYPTGSEQAHDTSWSDFYFFQINRSDTRSPTASATVHSRM